MSVCVDTNIRDTLNSYGKTRFKYKNMKIINVNLKEKKEINEIAKSDSNYEVNVIKFDYVNESFCESIS